MPWSETLLTFEKTVLPSVAGGVLGAILIEPFKAYFMEPLKVLAVSRKMVKQMRRDLYKSLSRDIALLSRMREMHKLDKWPPALEMKYTDLIGDDPRKLLDRWVNGNLLEDFNTETFDDWRAKYPIEYHRLGEADFVRDFYRRLKDAVTASKTDLSLDEKVEKFLSAYEWLLSHIRRNDLDEKLLRCFLKQTETEFVRREKAMARDIQSLPKGIG